MTVPLMLRHYADITSWRWESKCCTGHDQIRGPTKGKRVPHGLKNWPLTVVHCSLPCDQKDASLLCICCPNELLTQSGLLLMRWKRRGARRCCGERDVTAGYLAVNDARLYCDGERDSMEGDMGMLAMDVFVCSSGIAFEVIDIQAKLS